MCIRDRRPILFYIHGGGYNNGSGSSPLYDGGNLCRRGDVVVVTVNHRLNAFGYLFLAELAGPELAYSGNVGQLDLVQALQWAVSYTHLDVYKRQFLTIAGQTAPQPGITLIRGGIDLSAHDAVIQHIRVRAGEAGLAKMSGTDFDSISTVGAYNVIVDHCSLTWSTDENLSASGTRFKGDTPEQWREGTSHRITFSNNILAEGLGYATHAKGEHSKGSLIHDNARCLLYTSRCV